MNKLHEELLPIELNGLDIILGMDWVSANDAEILCMMKMVRVNPPRKESFMVYRDKCTVNSGIISLMKARRCFSKRCTSYVAFVTTQRSRRKKCKEY